MDKTELLRYFSGSDFFHSLSNGELKLYILLLARADDIDVSCKISFREIEKIEGRLMVLKRLKSRMTSLEKYGLAAFEKIEEWPHGELTFKLKRPCIQCRADADKKSKTSWKR